MEHTLDQRNNPGGCIIGALTENQLVKQDTKSIFKNFEILYSKLAGNLLPNFPKPSNWYTIFVDNYYRKLALFENFKLVPPAEEALLNYWKKLR